jgi:hypothetical protein
MKMIIFIPIAILLAKMIGKKNKKVIDFKIAANENSRIIHPAEFNIRW